MKFFIVLCLVSVALLGYVNALPVNELNAKWEKFKIDHKKNYDATEEVRRKEIFRKNVELIDAHNKKAADGLVSYTLGINQFADWTEDEKQAMLRPADFPNP